MNDTLEAVINGILKPVFALIPNRNRDRDVEAGIVQAMITALTAVSENQVRQNQLEAQHRSIFVAGWRPAVGWVCVSGLAFNYLAQPILEGFGFALPELNIGELITLLVGMLGLGGYRSYEKRIGVTK